MNKVCSFRKFLIIGSVLFFSVFLPLPNVVLASSVATNTSSTEDKEKQTDIKINVKKKTLVTDSSYTLILYNLSESQKVSFKSSDSDVASVNKEGVVSALKVGEATITATVKDGSKTVATLTCDITVGPPAIYIKFKKSEITLVVGQSTLLETILKPNNTVEEVKFQSSDISVASISSNGRITAKSAGSTYIYGSISNGKYEKILVTVVEEGSESSSKAVTQ